MRTEEQVLIAMFEALIPWYEAHKRELPWRQDREPYHVWLSEIMLQQTRVEAVKEYYRRFVTALPTIPDLAEAPEEQILKLWEGLGYYNRARNLKKAASLLVERYDGRLPADYDLLLSLPGIGRYTAGAIASIAYGLAEPAVDGNVLRVHVGSVDHPMLPEHFIEWVYVQTEHGGQRKALKPGDAPEVSFCLGDDKATAVYAYCNLHGLWMTEL